MKKHFETVIKMAACSLLAVAVPALAQGEAFTITTCAVGSRPDGIAVADVNGDGRPDLISANNLADTLTVLTNNGSGGFGSNATLTVGSGPYGVVAVNVNGDGKPDLICANNLANTLTVLTNNGNGGFGSNATLTVGSYPVFVVAADVNGDGKPDLICANNGTNTLTVLTNNGSGHFGFKATLVVGNRPYGIAAADLNGDGKLDLISANFNDNTLTVLTNNGSGGFGSNATLTVGSGPYAVVAVDVNGDGKPDLISANYNAGTLTVLTNNGSGSFGSNATLTVSGYPDALVAADMNGDGKIDLISANLSVYPNAGTLTVLTNNGAGGFGSNTVVSVGLQPFSLAAADLNGDGAVDLISANHGDNTLTVLMQPPGPLTSAAGGGGQFRLSVTGVAGQWYLVQASTNLVAWIPVATNMAPFTYTDANPVAYQQRFFRAVLTVPPPTAVANLSPPTIAGGQISFTVSGTVGQLYVLQASTNLVNWVSIETNAVPFTFSAPVTAANTQRFFRALAWSP
ncbi:MAG TPA: VCBS repeat-containing protein [Candidatus Paceibacterota bacterium]|nr:VCBS repeat-containing protein [Candidatus Paceibacterota bacterium]